MGEGVIGGKAPISVQSMTKTRTEEIDATAEQIRSLTEAGCDMVRVAVPNQKAAGAIGQINGQITIPLIADIHFDYRLAITALENGADKIRINPGNIGSKDRVLKILAAARERGKAIRIGVNSGSLRRDLVDKYGGICPEALVESALEHVELFEEFGFEDIVLSLKASDVKLMIEANRLISEKVDYPLHLGVTEAGTIHSGTIKSSVGIGTLLAEGIGDTIRVSLTGDPVEEVRVGKEILRSLGLRTSGIDVISCPTCGRLEVDLIPIAEEVERKIFPDKKSLRVAIMGCAVNGPGEAREADIGVACGKGSALLFKRGKIVRKIKESEIVEVLLNEIEAWDG